MFERLKSFNYPKELIVILLSSKAGAFGSNLIIPILFYIVYFQFIPFFILLAWIILQIITFTIRMRISTKTLSSIDTISKEKLQQNLFYYISTIFINSFLWGIAGLLVITYATSELYLFVFFVVYAGLSAASTSTLSAVFHAVFIFIFNFTVTIILSILLFANGLFEYFLAFAAALYMLFTMPSAYNNYLNMYTNIKRKERIEEQNSNFHQLLDVTMEAIIIHDLEFRIIEVNNAALKLFEVDDIKFLEDKTIFDFVPEQSLARIEQAVDEEDEKPFETNLLKSSGEIFPAIIKSLSMQRAQQIIKVVTVVDISLIKQQQEQLLQSEKMKQMGEMIGNIAHQWRQPLSVITTTASGVVFKKEYGTLKLNDLEKDMEQIIENTNYLSETIDIFRDYIKDKKEFKELILEDVVQRSLKIIQPSLKNHSIELNDSIDYTKQTAVMLIVGELPQVLINILNNAKDVLVEKNIENPQVNLNITTNSDKVLITIEDNAGGIPDNIIPKIFDPYFTTKHQSKGTGLGLHMSYRIITESLDGNLYVQNTQNGAKFFIELPLQD